MLAASNLDWSEIDPSILGTLFERGLDSRQARATRRALYRPRQDHAARSNPVGDPTVACRVGRRKDRDCRRAGNVPRPQSRVPPARDDTPRPNGGTARSSTGCVRSRCSTRPAARATSSNLALQALKDLEHRVQLEAEALGFQRAFPEIGPANVKGIEINPYAAELARVSVWIGEIQWMRRNGFSEARDPILKPLDTIECRDAILTPDNNEPAWPQADVVIGNPPFLGGNRLISNLGEDYYAGRVPASADLVCYWFEKAGRQIASGYSNARGAGRDQFHSWRREPAGVTGRDQCAANFRGVERRTVGDRRCGRPRVASLLLPHRRPSRAGAAA